MAGGGRRLVGVADGVGLDVGVDGEAQCIVVCWESDGRSVQLSVMSSGAAVARSR